MWKNIAVIGMLLLAGCTGLGTFQSPEVLPRGKKVIGFGAPFLYLHDEGVMIFPIPELYGRLGLGANIDIGLRMPWIIAFGGAFFGAFYGDIKYQFIRTGIFSMSGNIGVLMWAGGVREGVRDAAEALFILYPGIFLGNRALYGGVQYPIISGTFDDMPFVAPGVVKFIVGSQFGERIRINPAVNFWVYREATYIIGEMSIEVAF